ncbi:MAG: signal peptidase II [Oscillospiraceae bacterium]|nr:signal peptidase II [Oscillospiraceae bacterium]
MQYLWMVLAGAGILAADQLTKFLVVENISLFSQLEAIPGLFHLTYVQNTGAAFSALQGMQWLFVAIFALFTVGVIWEFSGKRLPFTTLERWCIVAVYAGGLGNVIDRVRLGYVVDMIAVDFIDFPVFNVADCFITCGCILLMIHLVFFNRQFWKEEKK